MDTDPDGSTASVRPPGVPSPTGSEPTNVPAMGSITSTLPTPDWGEGKVMSSSPVFVTATRPSGRSVRAVGLGSEVTM